MNSTAKILVVDDEKAIRLYLEEILIRDGYQVTTLDNGHAALARIRHEDFDLALVDLKLGDMEGTEILAAIRQQSPHTATILLTAHASLETAVEALRQGAHDYIFKPCKTVQIRESVRRGLLNRQRDIQQQNLLRQLHNLTSQLEDIDITPVSSAASLNTHQVNESPEEENRFLQQGTLIVDFLKHVITLDGYLLELSPTEFDLLAYLISEAPRTVPPLELVREVQGYQPDQWEASETVRSHIYHIRQKIKKMTGREEIIQTVRGSGYTIAT